MEKGIRSRLILENRRVLVCDDGIKNIQTNIAKKSQQSGHFCVLNDLIYLGFCLINRFFFYLHFAIMFSILYFILLIPAMDLMISSSVRTI